MIDNTTWYVGGLTSTNGYNSNAKKAYNYEVGANKDAATTVTSKIGMMYLSDYYYAASKEYWTLPGKDSNGSFVKDSYIYNGEDYSKAYNDNWMNTGLYEWTISPSSDTSGTAFFVNASGFVYKYAVAIAANYAVRPTFFLTSSVQYASGDGSISNPVRLKI